MPVDGWPATRASVTVHTRRRTFEADADTGRPADDLDRQWEALSAKFFALASPVIEPERAAQLHASVERIEQAGSMREVVALTCPDAV